MKGKRKGGPVAVDYTYMYNVIHVRRNLSCPVLNSGRIEYTILLIRKKRKREGNFNIFIRLFFGGPQPIVRRWINLDAWRMNESSCHAFSSLLYQGLNLSVDFHLFLPPFTPL